MKRWSVGDVMTHDVASVSEEATYREIVRKLAMLVAHLYTAVPGVVEVRNHLSWDFDDTEMTASGYFRSHPFSTEFKK